MKRAGGSWDGEGLGRRVMDGGEGEGGPWTSSVFGRKGGQRGAGTTTGGRHPSPERACCWQGVASSHPGL